jgi:serine protease Do
VSPTDLQGLSSAIRNISDRVGSSVVGVNGRGCGIVVSDGLVVTNTHNLGGPTASVTFADGREAVAELAGADIDRDLALLRVETGESSPIEDAEATADLGDVVFALSRPGGRSLRVTVGTVSSVDRTFRGPRGSRISGGFEHTAPLPRGSSGGPVVDAGGRLVGLNTHRIDNGFYIALPAGDELRSFVEAAAAGQVAARRSLGVAVVPPAAARRMRLAVGLPPIDAPLIRGVDENGPAGRAGLRRGDQVVKAGDLTITTVEDLQGALALAGESIVLRIVRGAEELDVLVEFESDGGPAAEA